MTTMNERPTNPGIGYILLQKRLKDMEKEMEVKDATIARLTQENNALLEANAGITLPGWHCLASINGVSCDTFNGEMHSKRADCRHCGAQKPIL